MDGVPCIEDHQRVTILIRQVGPRNTAVFNRIVDRLARQRSIQGWLSMRSCSFLIRLQIKVVKYVGDPQESLYTSSTERHPRSGF